VQAGEHTLKVIVNNQGERTVATSEAAVVTVTDE
jgi:hypothetical protein